MLRISKNRRRILFTSPFLIVGMVISSLIATPHFQSDKSVSSAASCGTVYDPLPSWILQRISQNKPVYIQAALTTGVPWEVIAGVHYRETSLSRTNPNSNSDGLYQIVGSNYGRGNVTSDQEFLNQTIAAANFIQTKASTSASATSIVSPRRLTTNETSINLIKNTLFSYNGRATVYKNQAETLGFNKEAQPYEGSPYVMNLFDCKRSSMGLITKDYGSIDGIDYRFGAFTLYARLKGDAFWLSLIKPSLQPCEQTMANCVWEFVNEDTGRRFYTSNPAERDAVYKLNYSPVGISFYIRKTDTAGTAPVYRLYNFTEGWHFWTPSSAERNGLLASGKWRDEGVAFSVDPSDANTGDPVRRLYTTQGGGIHVHTSNGNTIRYFLNAGYIDEGVKFTSIHPAVQVSIPKSGYANVYRFRLASGSHLWTTNVLERNTLLASSSATYEGVGWETTIQNGIPIYRVYSPQGKHFWTANISERNALLGGGWRDEGVAWNTTSSGTATERLYDTKNGNHLFTTSQPEKSILQGTGYWRSEGVAWRQ